jgi:hypothetical protein
VFIAIGAFWLSFTSLTRLAHRSGIADSQAWAWPLIVDGIIVVATVSVVALARRHGAWYPWTLLTAGALVSVAANAIQASSAPDLDVPRLLAGCVAAVPPLVLLAITHLTVVLTRPPAAAQTDHGPATPRAPADGDRPPAGPPARVGDAPIGGDAGPRMDLFEPPAWAPAAPGEAGHGAETSRRAPGGGANASAGSQAGQGEWPPGADRPAARRAPASKRRQAERLKSHGWSNRQIAARLEVHPSTVGRWFAPRAGDGAGDDGQARP